MPSRDYLYVTSFQHADEFHLVPRSMYLYGHSPEMRSHVADTLMSTHNRVVQFIKLEALPDGTVRDVNGNITYELRDSLAIKSLLASYNCHTLYIDCSGFDTRVCAPLLQCSLALFKEGSIQDIHTVYAEPMKYKVQKFCAEGVIHDLAERIEGIQPLPGFASIVPVDVGDICFVPLLGFEGGRFTHLLEEVQPPSDNIFPVIGVPGFRAEYPFVAYWGNRLALQTTDAWRNIRYIAANSLVDAFDQLLKIKTLRLNNRLKIAPIGTKPHAIGAILFAIKYPEVTELVYDNPKRERQRTDGIGRIIDTHISRLYRDSG